MKSLSGMVGIVTGAGQSTDIGAAVATLLRERGVTIVTTDTNGAGMQVDVTNGDEVSSCVSEVLAAHGKLDILVNNAGTSIGSAAFLEQTATDFEIAVDVNVRGMMLFSQAVIPHMRDGGGGSIVNIASLSGLKAMPAVPPVVTASRFAAVGMSKAIAQEFGPDNIRCNAVCPGAVTTGTRDGAPDLVAGLESVATRDVIKAENSIIALGRRGEPAEIAALVAYLCSPAGAYITGTAIPVDGGMGL
ncbi:MAG: SDR family oxidoreductase [Gammaproteobacteria bacterium]|nr:SDR family oxidoreductase [Gammaproteobacteria bacterium]